ncbi:MAG: hypothetical protein QOH38_1232, partial [Thermoleophilaceae bacterium]|nr:hypothetical protein [Thermoleophilaceae bacterium]
MGRGTVGTREASGEAADAGRHGASREAAGAGTRQAGPGETAADGHVRGWDFAWNVDPQPEDMAAGDGALRGSNAFDLPGGTGDALRGG